MKIRFLLLLSCLLCLAGIAPAQTVAIRAGHVVDPATGTVKGNQIILIHDGKITEIGTGLKIPSGAKVVDLSGAWVLPGLMDVHTHLTLQSPVGQTLEDVYQRETSALRGMRGLRNACVVLEAGFTVVKEIGNAANYADTDMRRAIERGWFPGPTIFNAGKIITPFGGQSERVSPEQPRLWLFEYLDADSPGEIRKAVEEAHRAGVTVGVHVNKDAPARNVILGGADSIEHGTYLSDEILRLMKERGTFLVGTDFPYEHLKAIEQFLPNDAKTESDLIIDRLRRAHTIGVKMAFGSDVFSDLPGKTRSEMMLDYLDVWLAAGVPPAGILKAMTTNAAELLRIQDQRGAIAPGLAADIIATPKNPLDDIHTLRNVNFVMKDGKIIKQ